MSAFDYVDAVGGKIEQVSQLEAGDVVTFATTLPKYSQFQWTVKIVIGIAIFAFVSLIIYKMFIQYHIKARVKIKQAGKVVQIIDDRCREVVDTQGKRKLVFFKLKGKTTPIPELRYRYMMGKTPCYEFELHDNGQLYPIDLIDADKKTEDLIEQVSVPQDRIGWYFTEMKELESKLDKKNWFDKYKETVIMGTAMVLAFLICFFAFKYVAAELRAVANAITEVARRCI